MISFSQFRDALRRMDGQRFTTLQKRVGFTVRASEEGPEYTPESSGAPRADTWASISRVLDRFNELGSFRPTDYTDLTHHSSYVLTLLKHVLCAAEVGEDPAAATNVEVHDNVPAAVSAGSEVALLSDTKPHQRLGSVSNAHVGSDFERVAKEYFARNDVDLKSAYPLEIGLGQKKVHYFDLGSSEARVLVECKSHKWTAGGRVPSAKMTVWNEAMYYFLLAPPEYRKVLFVLHHRREQAGESLLAYYKRTYAHMIPDNVEFIEWDEDTGDVIRVL